MTSSGVDEAHFFDTYPRFVDSSETGPWTERLNARYMALIHSNRHVLDGARVLDIGSHDGRFAFAALKAGATHVTAVDVKAHLIEAGRASMDDYCIASDRYAFIVGDLFEVLAESPPVDVVLCLGILYHLNDHMRLLTAIAELSPRAVIVDTMVSTLDGAVIEVRSALGKSPPEPGAHIEGYPTRAALDAMITSFGWSPEYFDWSGSGLLEHAHTGDYREQSRVSVLVSCPDHAIPVEVRQRAVADVLASDHDRESEFIAITMVAREHAMTPQGLRVWVNQARRQAGTAES